MGTQATRLDRVLAASRRTHAEVEELDVAVIRHERDEARREETELSYLRRILHGRIDIISAEQDRRAAGGDGRILDRLSSILADDPPADPRSARHMDIIPPAEPGEYRARMEARLDAVDVSAVLDRTDDDLAQTRGRLEAYEKEVSEYRAVAFAVIDRFAAELMRRYRDGETSVDDLLNEEQEME